MAWIRISDDFRDHPKFLMIGNDALALWMRAMAYANSRRTDGMIPDAAIPLLAQCGNPQAVADSLVAARPYGHEHGLFDRVEGGYRIHDYLEYQRASSDISKVRSEAGKRGADARWGEDRPSSRRPISQDSREDQGADGKPMAKNASQSQAQSQKEYPPSPRGGDNGAPSEVQAEACPDSPPTQRSGKAKRQRRTKPAAPAKPDLDPHTLSAAERAAYDAILADPSLPAIVPMPAETAVDLAKIAPDADVPTAIASAGSWLRAHPTQAKRDGRRFLVNWLKKAQAIADDRAARAGATAADTPTIAPDDAAWLAKRWADARGNRQLGAAVDPQPALLAVFWGQCGSAAARAKTNAGDAWAPTARQIAAYWIRCYLHEKQARAGDIEDKGYPFAWLAKSERANAYGIPKRSDVERQPADSQRDAVSNAAPPGPVQPSVYQPRKVVPKVTHDPSAAAGARAVLAAMQAAAAVPHPPSSRPSAIADNRRDATRNTETQAA